MGNIRSRDNFYKTKDFNWLVLLCTKLANLLGRLMEHYIFSHFLLGPLKCFSTFFSLNLRSVITHTPSARFLRASLTLHRKVTRALNIVAVLLYAPTAFMNYLLEKA